MNRLNTVLFTSVALIAIFSIRDASPESVAPGRVVRTDSMHARRADHTSTLLEDGRVLIAGGMVENGVFLKSAELYNPKNGTFAATDNMGSIRVEHTATLLPNGKILMVGGLASRTFDGPGAVPSTEIYDPTTGHFIAGPSMGTPRTGQGAVLLPSQKVLIVGGADNSGPLASAEIYDPASNRFSATTSMHTVRIGRTAVVLRDGRVLVTGGGNGRAAEVYDPEAATWSAVGDMTTVREKFAATLLPDGRVLVTGGAPDSHWHPVRSAEVFDPVLTSSRRSPIWNLPGLSCRRPQRIWGTAKCSSPVALLKLKFMTV
jgi:hypothetical protein